LPLWAAALGASPAVPATASLIAETQGFVPGQALTVALRLDQDPGWHTYWQDPGDAGLATTLKLDLPQGVTAGPLQWPKPLVFKETGGLTCYGYLSPAILFVPLNVDASYAAASLELKGQSTWLVCKDVCIPGKGSPSLTLKRVDALSPSPDAPLFASLRPSLGQAPEGYKAMAGAPGSPLSAPAGPDASPPIAGGLGWMLVLALVGGVLLNLMPCVLPVLSIKALSFVEHGHKERSHSLALAWAFAAGVLASFWALAGLVLALKAGGSVVGWGFQFQQPGFVLFMAALVLVFSLNLFGLFEVWLPGSATQGLAKAGQGSGLAASFGQGLVMTLLATPCTAPFLGTALGFAFAAPAIQLLAIFTMVALGLALPYVLLAAIPGARAWLPKPGNWMLRFKEAMGFLLLATVVWLLWLLGKQVGGDAQTLAAAWLLIVAAAAWIWGRFTDLSRAAGQRLGVGGLALALVLLSGIWLWPKVLAGQAAPAASAGDWQAWSESAVRQLHAQGRPVFADFTADWCWTCKVNERASLDSDAVQAAFKQDKVALLKADWTRQDPAITAALRAQGRSGVPMYVFYPVQGDAKVLPEVITPALVLTAMGH
jgi:thiol:disulfide interchange protein DsbD